MTNILITENVKPYHMEYTDIDPCAILYGIRPKPLTYVDGYGKRHMDYLMRNHKTNYIQKTSHYDLESGRIITSIKYNHVQIPVRLYFDRASQYIKKLVLSGQLK